MLGGLRSYEIDHVTSMPRRDVSTSLAPEEISALAESSTATLMRTEIGAELTTPEAIQIQKNLGQGIVRAYEGARQWIDREKISALFGFNGRMDMTAALSRAARDEGIRYISVERSWFGNGIQLVPEGNCLSLGEVDRFSQMFRDRSLTQSQAAAAAAHVAKRFLRTNKLEWRVYNEGAGQADWPGRGKGLKALILPSSKNEFQGHEDWLEGWGDNTVALDELIENMDLEPKNCVVRYHPNWAENIGVVTGARSRSHYDSWAARSGVTTVPAESRVDTYALLDQCDIVILNGGSTAFEAAILGKPIICLGPAKYRDAGFSIHINGPDQWGRLAELSDFDPSLATRKALRFVYTHLNRFPQFVDFVRAQTTTDFRYYAGADPTRLDVLIKSGQLMADDPAWDNSPTFENEVVRSIKDGNWSELATAPEWSPPGVEIRIERRKSLRWVESLRGKLPRGDKG